MTKLLLICALVALLLGGCGGGAMSIGPLSITPGTASLLPNGQKQFTLDQDDQVDWSAPDGGAVVDGLFTAPNATGTFRVVAVSALNPLVSATAVVTVSTVAVAVSPVSVSVAPGSVSTDAFTAVIAGSANRAVTWTVDQSNGGTIADGAPDGDGNARATYTAPATPGSYTIRATSSADPTVSDIARIQVLGASSIGLSPRSAKLSTTPPGNAVVLTAVLTDALGHVDSTTTLTWDVPINPVGGSLSGSDSRQRTFTLPVSFLGSGTCQVRVRTPQGSGVVATIRVVSG